jgi:glycosyltransferase involved in cell wall biosynthesis
LVWAIPDGAIISGQPPSPPLVSVVMAAHDAEAYLADAVRSVLAQTVASLELVVVDDGSRDRTRELLEAVRDPRLVVLPSDERRGLATALNHGLEHVRGRYVARLDADDLALPTRLERQIDRLRRDSLGIVGSAVVDVDGDGRLGAVREMPSDPLSVHWHALFSSPFYHPTVLLDRTILDRDRLRYDASYEESEDYELWTRLLAAAGGANVAEPLVLYRVHAAQASQRRRGLQRRFQLEIAMRQIDRLPHDLDAKAVELAWRLGAGEHVPPDRIEDAVEAYLGLLAAFRAQHGSAATRHIARAAARTVGRAATSTGGAARASLLRRALALDPGLPAHVVRSRARRATQRRRAGRNAAPLLAMEDRGRAAPMRVVVVAPEPTPYRAPVYDRLARRPELDLTVLYSARTLMWRTWRVEPDHRALYLGGVRVPGTRRLFHHDFAVTPGIFRALARERADVVVVVGWSTFASQGALAWCRARGVPYILEVDSHDEGPRAGWRRAVKGAVVPPVLHGAAGILVTGTLVRRSLMARGADPGRMRLFAVTVDVAAFGERADELGARREELRRGLRVGPADVAVLSVGRLSPEKGLETLVRAVAAAGDPCLVLLLAGQGPQGPLLEELARTLDVRLVLLGDRPWERIAETYVAADVFALLSEREPWGVVVNEAAACGLPLVLSDRVGAVHDLLRDGENGALVCAGDVEAAAAALRRLAADPGLRASAGARSRDIVAAWGYEPSIESFVAAVRDAIAAR